MNSTIAAPITPEAHTSIFARLEATIAAAWADAKKELGIATTFVDAVAPTAETILTVVDAPVGQAVSGGVDALNALNSAAQAGSVTEAVAQGEVAISAAVGALKAATKPAATP